MPASTSRSRTRSTPTSSRSSARARSTSGRRRHERHPGGQPGHPGRLHVHDLRHVPVHRLRQGVVRDRDRRRPARQADRHPGPLRLELDHAPGAAQGGGPDARRRDHRRVPGLHPGAPRSSRARSMPRPASPTTSRSSSRTPASSPSSSPSTTSVPLPGPGLVTGTKTLEAKADALKAFTAATLRAMDEITADPQKGLDATFAAVPDLAKDPGLQRQILDATIATWKNAAHRGAARVDRPGRLAAVAGLHDGHRPRPEPDHGGPAGGRVAAALTRRAAPRGTAPGHGKAGPQWRDPAGSSVAQLALFR